MVRSIMNAIALTAFAALAIHASVTHAQENDDPIDPLNLLESIEFQQETGGGEVVIEKTKCTDDDQDKKAWKDIDRNIEKLKALGIIRERISGPLLPPKFIFPLKNLNPTKYPVAWGISNYVDHDPNQGSIKDYLCGTRSYDVQGYNHKGIDIILYPFPWKMKQEGAVGIIAAAPGKIIAKYDGNFDDNCGFGNGNWNAVYIQHADGSIAYYGHMKKGSLTTKVVGDSVAQGEIIGKVGSSGSSTTAHLHFEVYDKNKKLIDPYKGLCNDYNTDSWWKVQNTYWVPRLHYIGVFSSPYPSQTCPNIETIPEVTTVSRGKAFYYHMFFSSQITAYSASCQIIRPNGSVWQSYTQTTNVNYPFSYWYRTFTIGTSEATGSWKFKCTYNGATIQKVFKVT